MATVTNPAWFDEAMARGGTEFLDKLGQDVEFLAIGFAPESERLTDDDEHHLKDCIGHEMRDEKTVRIGTGVGGKPHSDHATYVELGTGPHEITIKNAKVLTDGARFFGKRVHHPGTAPNPFLSKALFARRSV